MAQEDFGLGDAGLALGLSLGTGGGGGGSDAAAHHSSTTSNRQGREAAREAVPSPRCALEPSLTLSMPDEATATGTGTASGGGGGGARSVSSLSVKRERADEAEVERASSTAAARGGGGAEDDDDGSTRKKLRLTKEQSALLEDRFKEHSTLNPKQKVALAKQLNLRPRQVEVWFQNRRARTKLKQTEVDCEFLKRCCETLTEENRRLQREVQELRALKHFGPPATATPAPSAATPSVPPQPFYMQLPAATLSICPSCDRATKADADVRPNINKAARTTHHFFNPFTHSAAC